MEAKLEELSSRLNLPVRKFLGIDVGIQCTAFVRKEGSKYPRYGKLEQTAKFKSMETLQDNLFNYLYSKEGTLLWEGVDVVGIEKHWGGVRPTRVSCTLTCLEFSLRAFFLFHGIEVHIIPAASYKRALKTCMGSHGANKKRAAEYALEKLDVKKKDGRIHDMGDAAMICDYLSEKGK